MKNRQPASRVRSIGEHAVEQLLTEPASLWRAARELYLHESAAPRAEATAAWEAMAEVERVPFAQRALSMTTAAAASYRHLVLSDYRLRPDDRLLSMGG
jgi:hypothetical protein